MNMMTEGLRVLTFGLTGIFFVMGIIFLTVYLMNRITIRNSMNRFGKDSENQTDETE